MTTKNDQQKPAIPVNEYLLWQEIYRSLIQIAKAIKKYKLDNDAK